MFRSNGKHLLFKTSNKLTCIIQWGQSQRNSEVNREGESEPMCDNKLRILSAQWWQEYCVFLHSTPVRFQWAPSWILHKVQKWRMEGFHRLLLPAVVNSAVCHTEQVPIALQRILKKWPLCLIPSVLLKNDHAFQGWNELMCQLKHFQY